MNYLLVMSLSGSSLFLFYLFIKRFGGGGTEEKWKYILLKASMLYFLIPLPFLKKVYLDIIKRFFEYDSMPKGYIELKNQIIYAGETVHLNDNYKKLLLIFIIWLLVSVIIFGFDLLQYTRFRRRIMRSSTYIQEEAVCDLLELLKKEYRIKRKIAILLCREEVNPFTIGIRKPIIILNQEVFHADLELTIRHELVHIKRYDALVRMLRNLAQIVHWYNPMIYLFKREMDCVCEMSCDERVVKCMSKEQRECYAKLIVHQAGNGGKHLQWAATLSHDGKNIKERIIYIMKGCNGKKKRHGIITGLVICMVVVLNSITVFAYENVTTMKSEWEPTESEIKADCEADVIFYLPDSEELFSDDITVIHNNQFTDEDGRVFPIHEGISTYATCSHSYVAGTAQYHQKNANGSCVISIYNAKRCTKCGGVIKMSLISQNTYNPCKH